MNVLRRLLCFLGRHEPREYAIRRGTLAQVLAGDVSPTLEFRCRQCYLEVPRDHRP